MLFNYRISKYDPQFRSNGIYTRDEWTSVGDVGKYFGGSLFTFEEYLDTENRYIGLIQTILQLLQISHIKITKLEDYRHRCPYANNQTLFDRERILSVIRDCLREQYWCEIKASSLVCTFGYDYYIYIKYPLNFSRIKEISSDYNLYVENNKTF